MVNKKTAAKMAKEIIRCERVIQDKEIDELSRKQAENKINLISKAYGNNLEMLLAIADEADKLVRNGF